MSLPLRLSEAYIAVLFIICIVHAWRHGYAALWRLVAGVLFGVVLEWATIEQLHSYHYGRFTVMLGPVPLVVGVAWGVIVYSCQLFSNSTTLPPWARPILDGLVALQIDLAMDALAIRLGMWDWGHGFSFEYFGVPYANFWAWFWVVSFFSAGLGLFASAPNPWSRWLGPIAAIIVGVSGVLLTNAVIVYVVPHEWYAPTIAATLGGALLLVLALRPRRQAGAADPLGGWVIVALHLYFLVIGLLTAVIVHPPVLLAVSLVMLGLAWYLHAADLLSLFPQRGSQRQSV